MTEKEKPTTSQTGRFDTDEEEILTEPEPVRFVLSLKEGGERLDKIVARHLPDYSRSRIQRWIEQGYVTVDGKAAQGKQTVVGDEEIVVLPQLAEEDLAFVPEPVGFPVLFEDRDILVVNKPAGLVVHPAAGNWSGTLLNGLLHHLPKSAAIPRAGIVHRLDKDTSGLMVVAKTLEAQTHLVRQLQARTVRREYLALVWGETPVAGTVDQPIGRHPKDRIKMAVLQTASGKPAVTHYRLLETGVCNGSKVSLVKCRLETGRTHQIRVHMQFSGFPLVGDPLYGKSRLSAVFPRQALHAFRLGLLHPAKNEWNEWMAPLPSDMRMLLAGSSITESERWYESDYS
ncbi:RluA family pseudouridine synthase [Oxalobacter paraformigenes]|uniref:Pseudouridine synthase n=1 Tax=Oxalobacter paraformigenes TaxID=556268 RepID=C3X4X7_9BURK|nr:RluA family pseudouridine synthase [Oxalobacter paraformigenes]EEO28263.1 RluA family pseudouridine synthase [Oxalobacter paraformigenes]